MTFKDDILKGEAGENILGSLLEKCGFAVTKSRGKNDSWDLKASLNGKDWYFEVKYDLYSLKSQNIAIEFHNSKTNKPSGISATKSDFWVHIIPSKPVKILVCPTDKLLKLVKDAVAGCHTDISPLRIVYGGGDKNSDMILFQLSNISPVFVDFSLLSHAEIQEYIYDSHRC